MKKGGEAEKMKFPALRAFMRSYLHQDFGEEYGSVGGAVKAFCEDAASAEVATVLKEWREFLSVTHGKSVDEVNGLLGAELGSAWCVGSLGELEAVTKGLEVGGGS
ncbi:MAG TPA: contact-dependent growth inhibition system immunity protein [Candidatus Acidoferrales bacterium]